MIGRRLLAVLLLVLVVLGVAPTALADPGQDLTQANQLVAQALTAAQQGDMTGAKSYFDQFKKRWLEIEDGVKAQSQTAYHDIEEVSGDVQFALVASPVDQVKVVQALQHQVAANQKFLAAGYPADGKKSKAGSSGNVAQLLTLLDQAKAKAETGDAAGAAQAVVKFRQAWLDVEGVVLTQSSKVYGDAERDMVDVYALLVGKQPDTAKALVVINNMRTYLAPIAGKSSYGIFDAATILLREGLEALLVLVALLAFLKKSGQAEKSIWIWGGVGGGLAVSVVLALLVKFLFGTGAFGNNNFLIMGWTGLFAAVMLVWVSYWLHSKSHVAEWNRYIKDKSTAALQKGSLFSLATLAFLAVFREGTETVLFYVGMVSSISMQDLLLGLALAFVVLVALAVVILKAGVWIPIRPFFLVSSLLVFYLAFKFLGTGVHGLQLAGLLPASQSSFLPAVDALALYSNWESTAPQVLLLFLAVAVVIYNRIRGRALAAATEKKPAKPLKAQHG